MVVKRLLNYLLDRVLLLSNMWAVPRRTRSSVSMLFLSCIGSCQCSFLFPSGQAQKRQWSQEQRLFSFPILSRFLLQDLYPSRAFLQFSKIIVITVTGITIFCIIIIIIIIIVVIGNLTGHRGHLSHGCNDRWVSVLLSAGHIWRLQYSSSSSCL